MTRLVNPCKNPRYDDVYDKGVAALELRRDVRESAVREFEAVNGLQHFRKVQDYINNKPA